MLCWWYFIGPQFKYYISGKVIQHENLHDLDENNKVRLIDNFVAHLFSEIEVKKHNKVLDQIEFVGVASTVKGTVSYSLDNNGPTINSGYQSNFTEKNSILFCSRKFSKFCFRFL